jgi:site-specific recombinase XerD
MADELTPTSGDAALARWQELEDAVRAYARASKAPNTIRAYRSDLGDFTAWCTTHGAVPIPAPPETVARYITALAGAGAKATTIQRRLSAISQAHQLSGHEPSPTHAPLVRSTIAGLY